MDVTITKAVSKLVGKVKRLELEKSIDQSSIRCEEKITTTVTTCQLQIVVQNISCVYSGLYLLCSAAIATSGDAVGVGGGGGVQRYLMYSNVMFQTCTREDLGSKPTPASMWSNV